MNTPSKPPILTTDQRGLRFALALGIVLLIVLAFRYSGLDIASDTPQAIQPTGDVIGLETPIKFQMQREEGDQIEPLADPIQIDWQPEMTLLRATLEAGIQSEAWQSKWQGAGEMALLVELGGLANEGASGLNWQFDLNGEYGKQGAGQTVLKPGDSVLWRLAPYQ